MHARLPAVLTAFLIHGARLVCHGHADAQERERPIVVLPAIGDALDAEEREYFGLFRAMEGFDHAVFYGNTDGTVRAVATRRVAGVRRDTVSQLNRTLEIFRAQSEAVESARKMEDAGPIHPVRVHTWDGSAIRGGLERDEPDTLVLSAGTLGEIRVAKSDIKSVEHGTTADSASVDAGPVEDPNLATEFFMPAARVIEAGHGFIESTQFLFISLGVARGDRVMWNSMISPVSFERSIYYRAIEWESGSLDSVSSIDTVCGKSECALQSANPRSTRKAFRSSISCINSDVHARIVGASVDRLKRADCRCGPIDGARTVPRRVRMRVAEFEQRGASQGCSRTQRLCH